MLAIAPGHGERNYCNAFILMSLVQQAKDAYMQYCATKSRCLESYARGLPVASAARGERSTTLRVGDYIPECGRAMTRHDKIKVARILEQDGFAVDWNEYYPSLGFVVSGWALPREDMS